VVEQIHATCLTFDLSGHGRDAPNYGRRSVYDHLEDAVLAYEQLVSNPHVDRSFDHRVRE
jgi:hypothetical protein